MNQGSFELYVAVPSASGRSTKIREYGLNGRTFVEGRKGQPFSFVFKNSTAHRVLAVPSVDGLSVIDGGPATDTSRGYIVAPYGTVEVKGWRTSLNGIAQFIFEDKSGSYAATGEVKDTRNCGVIAMRVYSEKQPPKPTIIREEHHHHHHDWPWTPCPKPHYPPPHYPPHYPDITWSSGSELMRSMGPSGSTGPSGAEYCASANNMTCDTPDMAAMPNITAKKAALSFNLGAGFGTALEDKVSEAKFEKDVCVATLDIYYSDSGGLVEAGVELHKEVALSAPDLPQSFNGFCKPPAR